MRHVTNGDKQCRIDYRGSYSEERSAGGKAQKSVLDCNHRDSRRLDPHPEDEFVGAITRTVVPEPPHKADIMGRNQGRC
jgi:hypothetical protein